MPSKSNHLQKSGIDVLDRFNLSSLLIGQQNDTRFHSLTHFSSVHSCVVYFSEWLLDSLDSGVLLLGLTSYSLFEAQASLYKSHTTRDLL